MKDANIGDTYHYDWVEKQYNFQHYCSNPDTFTIYITDYIVAKIALAYHTEDNLWYGDCTWKIGISCDAGAFEVTRFGFGKNENLGKVIKSYVYQCWETIRCQAERQELDIDRGEMLKYRWITAYLLTQEYSSLEDLYNALGDYDDSIGEVYMYDEPVDPDETAETLGEYLNKQLETTTPVAVKGTMAVTIENKSSKADKITIGKAELIAAATIQAIEPGIYQCSRSYSNELGFKFKKHKHSVYVWEWFDKEDFCICSFGERENRIHLNSSTIRENWQRTGDLPVTAAETKAAAPAKVKPIKLKSLALLLEGKDITQQNTSTVPANEQPKTTAEDLALDHVDNNGSAVPKPKSEGYPGSKYNNGSYQNIINQLPPHKVFITGFMGKCAVFAHKKLAEVNIGIERDMEAVYSFWAGFANRKFEQGDLLAMLRDISSPVFHYVSRADTCLYLDPPYILGERRSGKRYYKFELSDADHDELISHVLQMKCMVAISHYPCTKYDALLQRGWRKIEWQVATRQGIATEALYMNYAEPTQLHEYTHLGKDKTERQRIKRKYMALVNKLKALPALERMAVISEVTTQLLPTTPPSKRNK